MSTLVETRGLHKYFPVYRGLFQRSVGEVRAVDGVDLTIDEAHCLALVGESGSGKSTLGRCILRLLDASAGEIRFAGEDLLGLTAGELRQRRRHFQMIFQDPSGSLNPRMRVGRILGEPLEVHQIVPARDRQNRVAELLHLVGLPLESVRRYPHEFSGGQRQRIGIARALAPEPRFLVADEPVSALDVSVRSQILNLLLELRESLGLGMLFIAHDLTVVEQIADHVAVLYLGQIVEQASTVELFDTPLHPYTVSLFTAVPTLDPERTCHRIPLSGEPPSAAEPPSGCRFHPRCPIATDRCQEEPPLLREIGKGHFVACHYPGELSLPPAPARSGGTF
jgi:peptide/nickel transport system ATP-binding protein/oligopeptide transport system ATP-binding protein